MGNDVVDLELRENRGKQEDRRFLDRVFTAAEQRLIGAAACPDALLWALWAAKEAAYKAVSRDDPTIGSIPRRYPVFLEGALESAVPGDTEDKNHSWQDSVTDGACLTGRILTPRGELALQIAVRDGYVHALAAANREVFPRIVTRVDRREERETTDDPSAFVRARLVREIADRLHLCADEIEIRKDPVGPGIPRIFHRGLPLADEISLSHDGRFTAFAWNPST